MMRYKPALTLSLILSFLAVTAQEKDSLNLMQNRIYRPQFDHLKTNPVQYTDLPLADFTETSLMLSSRDLNLKRTQTAGQITEYGFATDGIFNIHQNLRLFGSFNYAFIKEKELAYNLSSQRTENNMILNPNYLLVPKAGDWESQEYKVTGGASYRLSSFDFGATVNYGNRSSFRDTDPRPGISSADYSGKAFVGFNLGKHQISFFGHLGRKTEEHDIISVNEYINAPSFPDTFVRFSAGYGRIINFPSYSDFVYKTFNRGYGGGYAFQGEHDLITVNSGYSKSIETLFTKDAGGAVYFDESLENMKYRLKNYYAQMQWLRRGAEKDIISNLDLKSITGDNYSVPEQGQNFRMTLDRAELSNAVVWKDRKRVLLGLNTSASYSDFSATDLLGVTYKHIKSFDLQFAANRDLLHSTEFILNLEVGADAYIPLSQSLNYIAASSSDLMFNNVIAPDHAFDSTTKLGPQLTLNFYRPLTARTNLRIFTSFAALYALSSEFQDQTDYSGTPNLRFNAGISLFY